MLIVMNAIEVTILDTAGGRIDANTLQSLSVLGRL